MANEASITVEVRLRWWVWFYLDALKAFCGASLAEPDAERIAKFISRYGIVVRVPRRRRRFFGRRTHGS